jgi:hypothetical protein
VLRVDFPPVNDLHVALSFPNTDLQAPKPYSDSGLADCTGLCLNVDVYALRSLVRFLLQLVSQHMLLSRIVYATAYTTMLSLVCKCYRLSISKPICNYKLAAVRAWELLLN